MSSSRWIWPRDPPCGCTASATRSGGRSATPCSPADPHGRRYPVTRDCANCAICMGHFFMRKPRAVLTRVLLAGLLLASGGCAWLRPAPTPILPPDELYSQGEAELERRRYLEARDSFRKIVERH